MIQISHQQARRLIQTLLDGQALPSEPWAALHNHLESCAECRAYQKQLETLQRDLRRVTQARWLGVPGPRDGLAERITGDRQAVEQGQRFLRWSVGVGLAALLVFVLVWFRPALLGDDAAGEGTPVAQVTPATPTPAGPLTPTNTPKVVSERFRGVVLYEARQGGNAEIFLLNAVENAYGELDETVQPINLTEHPAEDSAPAWSPDGEWIAFLSDRTGKREVYVMHVSGARLVQVTDEPGIDWRGPLYWSPDGTLLGLSGLRIGLDEAGLDGAPLRWLYLVQLEGEDQGRGLPVRLTPIAASGQMRFSPTLPLLAYHYRSIASAVALYNLEEGISGQLNSQSSAGGAGGLMYGGEGGAFDWSPDGEQVVYLLEGPYNRGTGRPIRTADAKIRVTTGDLTQPTQFSGNLVSAGNPAIEMQGQTGEFRQVSWTPDGWIAYLAKASTPAGDPPCWTLRLRPAADRSARAVEAPGLCIEGGLERASWTANRRWVTVLGRLPGETALSLWALRVGRINEATTRVFNYPLRLVEGVLAGEAQSGHSDSAAPGAALIPEEAAAYAPRLRPETPPLGLNPQPLRRTGAPPLETGLAAADGPLPPSSLSSASQPPLLISAEDANGEVALQTLALSTGQRETLLSAGQVFPSSSDLNREFEFSRAIACPTWSPDRSRAAFVPLITYRDGTDERLVGNTVWVVGAQHVGLARLAQGTEPPRNAGALPNRSVFNCPVWSPDGSMLASVFQYGNQSSLAMIPTNGGEVKYVDLTRYGQVNLLGWSPEGRALLHYMGRSVPQIIAVDPDPAPEDLSAGTDVGIERMELAYGWNLSGGWGAAYDLDFSPDGSRIALLTRTNHEDELYMVELQVVSVRTSYTQLVFREQTGEQHPPGALAWLPGDRMLFTQPTRVTRHSPYRMQVRLFGLHQQTINNLLETEEYIRALTWSPDGAWLAYATESGLWLLDVEGALAGEAAPLRVEGLRVTGLDW